MTSVVLFTAFLKDEQVCQTYFDFGFDEWRMYVVYIATYFPILVLSVDLVINRIALSYKHLLTNLIVFLLYVSCAWIASLLQNRPTYANHMAFKKNYDNPFSNGYNTMDPWTNATANNCLDNVFKWTMTGGTTFQVT